MNADDADRELIPKMNDSNVNEQFRHAELTKGIIGVFYEVYNELGHGFSNQFMRTRLPLLCVLKDMKFINRSLFLYGSEANKSAILLLICW